MKVKGIARRQDISDKYLEQIIAMLNRSGLVKNIRGAKGGYVLNDQPDKITVGQILEAAEGDMSVVDNLGDVTGDNLTDIVCDRFWGKLDESVRQVLDNTTLADLVEDQQALLTDQYMI